MKPLSDLLDKIERQGGRFEAHDVIITHDIVPRLVQALRVAVKHIQLYEGLWFKKGHTDIPVEQWEDCQPGREALAEITAILNGSEEK